MKLLRKIENVKSHVSENKYTNTATNYVSAFYGNKIGLVPDYLTGWTWNPLEFVLVGSNPNWKKDVYAFKDILKYDDGEMSAGVRTCNVY